MERNRLGWRRFVKIWNACLESKYRDGVGGWMSLEFRGEIWSTDRNSEMAKAPEWT